VRLAGGFPVSVPTRFEDGFQLTPQALRAAITGNTGLLILNYPSNPAGVAYTAEQLAEFAEICAENDMWILADEIYEHLTYDGHVHASIAAASEEAKRRTVLVNGLSKAFAMTGWRIGYAAGARELIHAMAKVQSHATSAPNSIAQAAGVVALDGPMDEVKRMRAIFAERRDLVLRRLRAMDDIECATPEGAFYVFPRVAKYFGRESAAGPIRDARELAYYLLEDAGVATVPGNDFGGPDHLRLSYATSTERLELALDRIAACLARLRR
jgi:aspartate aminotransferase